MERKRYAKAASYGQQQILTSPVRTRAASILKKSLGTKTEQQQYKTSCEEIRRKKDQPKKLIKKQKKQQIPKTGQILTSVYFVITYAWQMTIIQALNAQTVIGGFTAIALISRTGM